MKVIRFSFPNPARVIRAAGLAAFSALPLPWRAADIVSVDDTDFFEGRAPEACAEAAPCLQACTKGAAGACEYLGFMFNSDLASIRNTRMAGRFFLAGCAAGSDASCRALRRLAGEAAESDSAVSAWETSCLQGGYGGCLALSGHYAALKENPEAAAKAGDYRERGVRLAVNHCESGDSAACFEAASRLQGQVFSDLLAEPPSARAVRLAEMDCRNGSGTGCVRLAAWYRDEGNGRFNAPLSDAYLEDAERIFTARCGRDSGWIDCGNRAAANQRLHHYQQLYETWDSLREMAQPVMNAVAAALCDSGEGRSCYELGYQYEHGQNIDQSLDDALQRYESACALGEKAGCIRLAWLLENGENREDATTDIPRALSLYESACGDGGCAELAAIYGLGNLVPEDRGREKYYEEKGCDQGERCACDLLKASEAGPLTGYFCTMN